MSFDLSITACFTGHRPSGFGMPHKSVHAIRTDVTYLLRSAIAYLYDHGYRNFISGGALGVDQWAAYEVLDLKKQDASVNLTIARPFPSQDIKWPYQTREEFAALCNRADLIIDVSPDPYAGWKMHARNAFMVDNSSVVVAVKVPEVITGGTASCCAYAERKGKTMLYIDPVAQQVHYPDNELLRY